MKKLILLSFSLAMGMNILQAQIKFVCIGNSISHGSISPSGTPPRLVYTNTSIGDSLTEMSYRFWLWEKLDSAGVNATMVGWQTTYFNQGATVVVSKSRYNTSHTFVNNSEAYYGIKSDGFIAGGWGGSPNFDTRLAGYMPDVALMHIGTNDASGTTADVDATEANIRTIIQKLRSRNPNITILLAKLSTFYSPINGRVDKIVAETSTVNSIVYAVDIASDFLKDDQGKKEFLLDGVHPSFKGQMAMARRWYNAYMKITQADVIKPSAPTGFYATAMTASSIDFIWSASTDNVGVNVYNIYMNDSLIATTGNLNYKVTGINTTGKTYYFKVTAVDFKKNESSASTILKAPSTVTFNIKSGSLPLTGATVTFNSVDQTTDATGNTVFANIRPGAINYTIKAADYKNLSGRVNVTRDTIVNIVLSGVAMEAPEDGISVYPNPASHQLTLEGAEGCIIEMSDMMGHIALTRSIVHSSEIIDVNGLKQGYYLIKINKQKSTIIKKVRIER